MNNYEIRTPFCLIKNMYIKYLSTLWFRLIVCVMYIVFHLIGITQLIKCACEFNSYGEYEYMYCKLKLIPIFMALFKINRPITQIF